MVGHQVESRGALTFRMLDTKEFRVGWGYGLRFFSFLHQGAAARTPSQGRTDLRPDDLKSPDGRACDYVEGYVHIHACPLDACVPRSCVFHRLHSKIMPEINQGAIRVRPRAMARGQRGAYGKNTKSNIALSLVELQGPR